MCSSDLVHGWTARHDLGLSGPTSEVMLAYLAAWINFKKETSAEFSEVENPVFSRKLRFAGTPVKRTGRDRFVRNVLIAIGNSGGSVPGALAAVRRRLDDDNADVRAMAIWALGRLDPAAFRVERAVRFATEADETVRAEWQAEPLPETQRRSAAHQ